MPRHALRVFFERLVVTSLPLTMATCSGPGGGPPDAAAPVVDLAMAAPDDSGLPIGHVTPPEPCEAFKPVSVAIPAGYQPDGGLPQECRADHICTDLCPTGYTLCCGPQLSDGGVLQMLCGYYCPTGRRPAGLMVAHGGGGCIVGDYFATMAHLEAASVHAFRTLGRELAAHGAPVALVRAARRAAGDEVRHARATASLARAHGSTRARVAVAASASRSLEALAVENAAEGCVRETFGALLASWQARAAQDAAVRDLMVGIAVDETRHAELAWQVDAWARRRLDRAARRRVVEARRAEVAALAADLAEPHPTLALPAGLPDAAQARRLLAAVERELWS